jgi:Leucine-rich repeat (LRR) protein
LDLSCNKLTSLTGEDALMGKLVSLRNLVLDSNQFVSLPSSLNKLTALQFLSVRKNLISSNHVASDLSGTSQSPSLSAILQHETRALTCHNTGMVSLEGLDLSSNKLGEIPRQLCALLSLRYLALADNQLTYIREEMPISSLSSLTALVRAPP